MNSVDFSKHFVENTQLLAPGEKFFSLRASSNAIRESDKKVKLNQIAT